MDGLTFVERINVQYSGERGGEAPLTLGQLNTLDWSRDTGRGHFGVVHLVLNLPPGCTLHDITESFAILLARHESLRTSFPPGDPPCQRVAQSGELPIDVYAADESILDVAATAGILYPDQAMRPNAATSLVGRLRAVPFAIGDRELLRVAVAVSDARPKAAALACSHMIADLGSLMVIGRQFTELAADPAKRQVGRLSHQPLDQAAAERSARGRRRAEATLRFWESQLRRIPQCMYAMPADPAQSGEPLSGWLFSPELAQALPSVQARTGAGPWAAIAAAMVAVLAHRTRNSGYVFRTLPSNRTEVHLRDYVGTISQVSLLAVDTSTPSFDELMHRSGTAMLRSARYGSFHQPSHQRMVRELEHLRGIRFHADSVFNNVATFDLHPDQGSSEAAGSAEPGDGAAALPETFIYWLKPPSGFNQTLLEIHLLRRMPQGLSVGLWTGDTTRVPPAEIELLLRGIERLIVAAAGSDVDLGNLSEVTGVAPVERGPGWLLVDSCWVELAEVQRLLDDALDVPVAHVFAVPDRDGNPALAACLAASPKIRTSKQAHAACVAALDDRLTAMAPGHYSVYTQPPEDPSDLASWRKQRLLDDGDGRDERIAERYRTTARSAEA
jgi:hypothetical protein